MTSTLNLVLASSLSIQVGPTQITSQDQSDGKYLNGDEIITP